MLEWQAVDSKRITAEAYDPIAETIYVRFPNAVEWWYSACPPSVWEEFAAPATSKGSYIKDVLNHRPNGKHSV